MFSECALMMKRVIIIKMIIEIFTLYLPYTTKKNIVMHIDTKLYFLYHPPLFQYIAYCRSWMEILSILSASIICQDDQIFWGLSTKKFIKIGEKIVKNIFIKLKIQNFNKWLIHLKICPHFPLLSPPLNNNSNKK